jgi:hypothetical protein
MPTMTIDHENTPPPYGTHPLATIGSVWQINDTGNTFTITRFSYTHAYVTNKRGTERRIHALDIRPSNGRTGYTFVNAGQDTP